MDYRDEPVSVTEYRAIKSADAADWTPRDVLVSVLRDLDKGIVKIEDVVVGFRGKRGDIGGVFYSCSCKTALEGLGLMEIVKLYMWRNTGL